METVLAIQSILGFHLCNQGIPKITCCQPRLKIIRSVVSLDCEKRISMWAFHPMVSLALAIPSPLYAQIGLGRHCRGKFAFNKRPMLMKFPVAPQSMRAVVSMICVPVASLIGRWMVCSFGKATSTWDKSWEEDVETTSRIKNPHCLRKWWQQLHFFCHPHSKSSRSGGYLWEFSPWWWGSGWTGQWGWSVWWLVWWMRKGQTSPHFWPSGDGCFP